MEGLRGLFCGTAEEFGLDVVQTLLQQQRARLLVQRQAQSGLEFRITSLSCLISQRLSCFTSGKQMLQQHRIIHSVRPQIT